MPRHRIPHRRERILDVAEQRILEQGFDAVSVAALAEAVGIAKGAIYREFASKDAILDALLERGAARMRAAADAMLGDAQPSLAAAYRVGARVLLDDPLMTAAYVDDRGVLGARVDRTTDGRYRERHAAVVAWIVDLQREGRVVADVDAEALALALSSASLGLVGAASRLGPVTPALLEATLATIERMVATLETVPPVGFEPTLRGV